MNAMVLAAGLGTRLGSMGRTVPKVLIDIGGRPLLERHVEYLQRHGIYRVVINVHHLAARIESFVQSYDGPLEVVCVYEERLLGTAGGVRNALEHLEPGPFVVVYGDVLVEESLDMMLEFHREKGAVATLAVHEADSAVGKGTVEVQENGRVTRFAEKDSRHDGPALINSGIYVLESELVASLDRGAFSDFGEDVFPHALASGLPIFAYRLSRPVIDIGTQEGLSLARSSVTPCTAVGEDRAAEA